MYRLTTLFGAVALLLFAQPAVAGPVENLEAFCIQTGADRAAASAAAVSAGWRPAPREMFDATNEQFRDAEIYVNFDLETGTLPPAGEVPQILMIGWGSGQDVFGFDGAILDACAILTMGADAAETVNAMTRRFGFSPVAREEAVWLYSIAGGAFVDESALSDVEDSVILEVLDQRQIYMAGVMAEDPTMVALFVGAPRADR